MKWLLCLVLSTTLLACCSFPEVDIELDVDFNPCHFKKCKRNEKCKIVKNNKLLEVPIATCVKDINTQNLECLYYSQNTNILNCKTESDWQYLGNKKCNNTDRVLQYSKVRHVCHDRLPRRYLMYEFSCCTKASGNTPTVFTDAPPLTTSYTTENAVSSFVNTESSSTTITPPETNQEQVVIATDSYSSSNSTVFFYIILIGGICVVSILSIAVPCVLYKRKAHSKRNKKATSDTTVIINPYCDEYNFLFEDLSQYKPAPDKLTANCSSSQY